MCRLRNLLFTSRMNVIPEDIYIHIYPLFSLGGHNLFKLLTVQFNIKSTVFELRLIHCFISSSFQMPAARKQKKARKSRGIEMLSDIENLDIMLGEKHFNTSERDENLGQRQQSRWKVRKTVNVKMMMRTGS